MAYFWLPTALCKSNTINCHYRPHLLFEYLIAMYYLHFHPAVFHQCWFQCVFSHILGCFFFNINLFNWRLITILYWFCRTSTWICHGCTHVPNPEPPTSLPVPSLWVIPVHQPQASCILHWTWTGGASFLIWYYTCFNAILPNHPTLTLSHRVQKTVLYICVSFAVSHTGLWLPSF